MHLRLLRLKQPHCTIDNRLIFENILGFYVLSEYLPDNGFNVCGLCDTVIVGYFTVSTLELTKRYNQIAHNVCVCVRVCIENKCSSFNRTEMQHFGS